MAHRLKDVDPEADLAVAVMVGETNVRAKEEAALTHRAAQLKRVLALQLEKLREIKICFKRVLKRLKSKLKKLRETIAQCWSLAFIYKLRKRRSTNSSPKLELAKSVISESSETSDQANLKGKF